MTGEYEAGRYLQASNHFRALRDYRDCAKLASECEVWLGFFDTARKHNWTDAQQLPRVLSRFAEKPTVQRWRRWFDTVRSSIEALELLAQGPVPANRDVSWERGACPYAVFGLSAFADAPTIDKVSFDLMNRPMNPQERSAWDALRLPVQGLLADFCTFRIADPKRAGRLISELLDIDSAAATVAASDDTDDVAKEERLQAMRIAKELDRMRRLSSCS